MTTDDGAAPNGSNGASADAAISQPAQTSVAQSTVDGNGLICQWQGCNERQPTPEQLYVSPHPPCQADQAAKPSISRHNFLDGFTPHIA